MPALPPRATNFVPIDELGESTPFAPFVELTVIDAPGAPPTPTVTVSVADRIDVGQLNRTTSPPEPAPPPDEATPDASRAPDPPGPPAAITNPDVTDDATVPVGIVHVPDAGNICVSDVMFALSCVAVGFELAVIVVKAISRPPRARLGRRPP